MCDKWPGVVYRSVFTKQELSNTAKLSLLKSIYVPIFNYVPESWVMAVSSTRSKDWIFAQSSRRDTSR